MANTNADVKFFVCTTPQSGNLNRSQFEALDWIEVKKVGRIGETGTTTNIRTYDTLDTDVSEKGKGVSNAGDPDVEVSRLYNDPGQKALREMAQTKFRYAYKHVKSDAPSASYTDTTIYYMGLALGPRRPNGGREDFDLEVFQLALDGQRELVVDPELIGS